MNVVIRPALPDDAAAIAVVRVRSWQAAYAGLMPDALLDAMDPQTQAERLRERLSDAASPYRTLVAVRDGGVAAFSTFGPYRGDDVPPGSGEVLAIYAHPDHWSTGVGRALMDDTLTHLSGAGMLPVLLWVLRDNVRARRFYERAGFTPDGAEQLYDAGGVMVPEVRYRLTIDLKWA